MKGKNLITILRGGKMRRKLITLGVVLTLLSFVVINSQQGSASLNSNSPEKFNKSSKILSNEELVSIVGGKIDISDILDWSDKAINVFCAGMGLGIVFKIFKKVNPVLVAFCAGWGAGKALDSVF